MSRAAEILSMEDVTQKFKDRWVIVEVIEDDGFDNPRKLRVIADSKNREEIYEKQKWIDGDIAIFCTGEIPKKGYAVVFNG